MLNRFWSHTPPVALELQRISRYLGLEPPKRQRQAAQARKSLDEDLRSLAQGPMPIYEGRPNDPMLDFLDR